MPGTFSTTTRNALRWLKGTSLVSDVDEGFQRLAEDVDTKMASYWEGTFAARPAAGQSNRFYKATDTGELFHDTGTVWEVVQNGPAGAYSAQVERTTGVEYEPSATRPVQVILTCESGSGSGQACVVSVGGVTVGEVKILSNNGNVFSMTFIVPAGKKWKFVAAAFNVKSSYLTL